MAVGKEIRTKITSIQSTQKITSAMEMVAASKMRKAQDRMELGQPYSRRIRQVMGHIANASPEHRHVFMEQRDVKRVGYIIVSSDRGLCGGLNINVFKEAMASMKTWSEQGVDVEICAVGAKAIGFFESYGGNVTSLIRDIGENPTVAQLIGGVKTMLDAYENKSVDKLFIVSNRFVNTMTQQPTVEQLLPLEPDETQAEHYWDYLYEPDAESLIEGLLLRYVESQVHQAVVENVACEQAARMIAMKNASDNAGDLIDELQLVYNKARQAAITQELSEIVGGAAAVG